jgi:hypothetical protein
MKWAVFGMIVFIASTVSAVTLQWAWDPGTNIDGNVQMVAGT